jgi:hypothetical protein
MSDNIQLPKYPPVFFVKTFEKFRNFLLRLNRRFTHPNVAVMEMIQNMWLSGAISVASELGIADILKKSPKNIDELAKITETKAEPLYRIMRVLASNGIFKEISNNTFATTPLGIALQEDQMKHFVDQHLTKIHFQMFGELMYTAKTGNKSIELFIKGNLFDHISQSPELNEKFNKAMTNTAMMQAAAIVQVYPFSRYNSIVDIGGGNGFFMSTILSRFKKLKGTVFDLPHVVTEAPLFFEKYNISERASIIGGSFFDTIPPGFNLYIIKNILHNWDDESCIKILKNIKASLLPESKLLIMEACLKKDNNPSFAKMTDLLMMAGLDGKERSLEEYHSLLQQAGFKINKKYQTVSPLAIIEAVPFN